MTKETNQSSITTSNDNLLNGIVIQNINLWNSNDSFDVIISSSDSDNSDSGFVDYPPSHIEPKVIIISGNGRKLSSITENNSYLGSDSEPQPSTSGSKTKLRVKLNEWIECEEKKNIYGASSKVKKRRDFDEIWEYEIEIPNSTGSGETKIHEFFSKINNKLLSWNRVVVKEDGQVVWEISYFDETNKLKRGYKSYDNLQIHKKEIKSHCKGSYGSLELDINTFTEIPLFEDNNEQENNSLNKPINWPFIVAAFGIIPIVVYARVAQRVYSVYAADVDEHGEVKEYNWKEYRNNVLCNLTNLELAIADIIFTSLTSNFVNWAWKNIFPSCNCLNSFCDSNNDSPYRIKGNFINMLIHLFSISTNHATITGSLMYTRSTVEHPFTWASYGSKLLTDPYNFGSTLSRLYVMQHVNYLFKKSLNTLDQGFNISSRLSNCSCCINLKKFWKWINKETCIRIVFKLIIFTSIIVLSNGIKTFATLLVKNTDENDSNNVWKRFLDKFNDKWFWCSALTVTSIDGLNLFLNNYKKTWFFEPTFYNMCEKVETKLWWCWDKVTSCFTSNEGYKPIDSNNSNIEVNINENNNIKKFQKIAEQVSENDLGVLLNWIQNYFEQQSENKIEQQMLYDQLNATEMPPVPAEAAGHMSVPLGI